MDLREEEGRTGQHTLTMSVLPAPISADGNKAVAVGVGRHLLVHLEGLRRHVPCKWERDRGRWRGKGGCIECLILRPHTYLPSCRWTRLI